MCGIFGKIGTFKVSSDYSEAIRSIQHHRGPDYTGHYHDEHCLFIHNRLSIIDLRSVANQPMHDATNRYVIIFNGEIYNYRELKQTLEKKFRFETQSDTEVLLYAYIHWGADCLNKLNGMFAFAIWDKFEKKVFAARDRYGVKPFYYNFDGSSLTFSSEIKAIFATGLEKKPNEEVWLSYLKFGTYSIGENTFWQDVNELDAGHCLTYDLDKISKEKWYNFEKNISNTNSYTDADDLTSHYETLLKDAVSLRFRADVPVGFNISGGLDSSTLLAMVNHLFPVGENINAFSFYSNHEDYDELPWVKEMLKHTKNPLTTCLLTPGQVSQEIEKLCYFQDEPFGGIPTIAYGNIFKSAREKGIIVLLDGQGMDEVWAGYDYYTKTKTTLVQGSNSSPVRPGVIKEKFRIAITNVDWPQPFDNKLQNLQYRDLFYTKLPRALRFNDRFSMMHSTELREPFLDYRIVELAFAQPDKFKIRNAESKWLLRKIASKYLNNTITTAPKRPLQTPMREWLANELIPLVENSISILSDHKWFDADTLKLEWIDYLDGKSDNSFYVWQWINTAYLLK